MNIPFGVLLETSDYLRSIRLLVPPHEYDRALAAYVKLRFYLQPIIEQQKLEVTV